MKKTLTKISAIIVLCVLLLAGCAEKWAAVGGGPAADAAVAGNGGLTVQKGNFLFFINGTSSTTAANSYGVVEKGSIVRQDLDKPEEEPVIVVPKIVLSSFKGGGFYIFGDRLYYPSPSEGEDNRGNKLTSYLDFFSVKLDGTDNTKIFTLSANSGAYKFYQDAESKAVYLTYVSGTTVKTVDCASKDREKSATHATIISAFTGTLKMADDGYIYYNATVYDEKKPETALSYKSFMAVHYKGGQANDIAFLDGTPLIKSKTQMGDAAGEAMPKYDITLSEVKEFDGKTTLFYTRKEVSAHGNLPVDTEPFLYSYTVGEENEILLVASSTTDSFDFTNRFFTSPTAFFGTYNSQLYYIDLGLNGGQPLPHVQLLPAAPSQILFVKGDFVYYTNSSNFLTKKQFRGENISFSEGTVVLKDVALNTTGLSPEIVGNDLYFVRSNGDYINYVYRLDITLEEPEAKLASKIAAADVIEEDEEDSEE